MQPKSLIHASSTCIWQYTSAGAAYRHTVAGNMCNTVDSVVLSMGHQ